MIAAPAAQAQPEHRWAVALADQVMAEAQRRGQRVAVAIADHRGDPIQQDWMPDAPTAAVAVAQAVAAAAGTFSAAVRPGHVYPGGLAGQLGGLLPFPVLAAPGGCRLRRTAASWPGWAWRGGIPVRVKRSRPRCWPPRGPGSRYGAG